jgi:hypothetical protein
MFYLNSFAALLHTRRRGRTRFPTDISKAIHMALFNLRFEASKSQVAILASDRGAARTE